MKYFKTKIIVVITIFLLGLSASVYNVDKYFQPPVVKIYESGSKVNSNGEQFISMPRLSGTSDLQRIIQLNQVVEGPLDIFGVYKTYVTAQENKIDPAVPFCIAFADSKLGRAGRGAKAKNPCNVAHYDSNNNLNSFNSYKDGMLACVALLSQPQYRNTNQLGELSNGGRILLGLEPNCGDWNEGTKCWATSEENHIINMINCVREINNDPEIDFTYIFKK